MGNLLCMGLILFSLRLPTPRRLDNADHRLATGVNMDMLHGDFLLTLAAVLI
jgi:hypothetical protein